MNTRDCCLVTFIGFSFMGDWYLLGDMPRVEADASQMPIVNVLSLLLSIA